ncbi:hypothetical protein MOQ30_20595, partial [Stenotrophomonas maltophilia]|nr:hypothetical protein [Stenotrophomonas maltophilia]
PAPTQQPRKLVPPAHHAALPNNNGALISNVAGNTALGGTISGTGGLTQAGSGTLNVTGNNT